ncbi:MAG: dephospho-CoA kinase [Bacteroidia bacterium]
MKLPVIGITGGIGSGKSRVCEVFAALGYRIYDADSRAKWLMVHDVVLKENIRDLMGEEAYFPDETLNRAYIGQRVFSDGALLSRLNGLVHPATARDFDAWVENTPDTYPHTFLLREAAILFESGAYKTSDAVITVYAPKNIRINRVISRDKTTREAVIARMDKQWAESEKLLRSDFTIFNDGTHSLALQVRAAIAFFQKSLLTEKLRPKSQ